MFKKSLAILIGIDFVIVAMFVLRFVQHPSLVPLYIGVLPFTLCNFVFAREFILPKVEVEMAPNQQRRGRLNALPLLLMPFCFCITLPTLIEFDNSLGWSPVVSLGFSLLLSIMIIAVYSGVKAALKKSK